MIPGKEHLVYFEQLAKRQCRLFNDACDTGAQVSEQEKKTARQHLRALCDTYKHTIGNDRCYPSVEVMITFEQDGARYHGVRLLVSYIELTKKPYLLVPPGEYLSVDVLAASWPYNTLLQRS